MTPIALAAAALIFQRIHRGCVDVDARRNDFVQCGDGVSRADFAGVLLVVVEILVREHAVFVADQAIGAQRGLNST